MNLILAILGQTKFGKSTMLALLTNIFLRFLGIFSKQGSGRTKILTEYFYDSNNENKEIWITELIFREKECLGGVQDSVQAYNENLEKNPILSKKLGFKALENGVKPKEYLRRLANEFCNRPLSNEEIRQLLCTDKLDEFIKKVVVRVPANNILKKYLEKNNMKLSIRDTKGLLDFSMDETMKKSNANLAEIGLDRIDGALFGCSESYPNVVQEVYEDTLYNVFNSVPTFLVAKDTSMYRSFGKGNNISEETVSSFIDDYQSGKVDDYKEMDDEFFHDTDQLFTELKIMKKTDGIYSFAETYFRKNETEFLIPVSTTLKKFGTNDADEEQLEEAVDFNFLQMVISISVIKMIDKIVTFKSNVKKLKLENHARDYMIQSAQNTKDELLEDLQKYNNASHGRDASLYCKPQLSNVTYQVLEENIDDKTVDILGPNGGITTRNNGKLRYYTTAVVAVSARKWLDHIISNVNITEDIRDNDGSIMFTGLEGDYESQTKLVKNILRNCLYKEYTDTEATIQYHLCVNRSKASFGIEERRKTPILDRAFKQTIEVIVNDFCRALAESKAEAL